MSKIEFKFDFCNFQDVIENGNPILADGKRREGKFAPTQTDFFHKILNTSGLNSLKGGEYLCVHVLHPFQWIDLNPLHHNSLKSGFQKAFQNHQGIRSSHNFNYHFPTSLTISSQTREFQNLIMWSSSPHQFPFSPHTKYTYPWNLSLFYVENPGNPTN